MARRQKNGTGTFRKRPNGTIEYRVCVGTGMDGQPIRRSFYGDTEREANDKYKAWLKSPGEIPIERVKTVGEWADKWLELYKKTGKKKVAYSTYRNYEMYVKNHIKPHIGKLRFAQVRPAHIEQLYAILPEDMSQSARRHINIALNGIFKTAVENRFCDHNPVTPMPMPVPDPEAIQVFTTEQIKIIIAKAPDHRYGIYALLPLYTGMRIGECIALTRPCINYDAEQIRIQNALTRSEEDKYDVGPTKNKKTRITAMPEQLTAALKALPDNGFYVLSDDGLSTITIHQYEYRYKKFLNDIGVPYLSPHKCRHTYATYLLRGGADLRTVQTLLGHSRVSVTETYTHVNVDQIKDNVRKLGY